MLAILMDSHRAASVVASLPAALSGSLVEMSQRVEGRPSLQSSAAQRLANRSHEAALASGIRQN